MTLLAQAANVDNYLVGVVSGAGVWAYVLLFAVIFCETGLVVTAFLPGDTLFFIAATQAAAGRFSLLPLLLLCAAAALLGDLVNFWIGGRIGLRAFDGGVRFLTRDRLERTHAYFDRHGGKTIIAARFIPLLRTLAPFVAGMGAMPFPRFLRFTLLSVGVWLLRFGIAGYFFGSLPLIQENTWLILAVAILLPLVALGGRLLRRALPGRARAAVADTL